jgi:hypothetical protein
VTAHAERRDAARAAAAFAVFEDVPGIEPSVLADLALAAVRAGGTVAARTPAARAVLSAATADDLGPALGLAEPERSDVLLTLAEIVPPALALPVADALAGTGRPPLSPRLAAVLGLADPGRCAALLDALEQAYGAGSPVLVEATVEVVVAAGDAGAEPPVDAARRWHALAGGEQHRLAEAELAVGRLRLAARREPGAAVAMLAEALDAVGAEAVAVGADAVLGRLGATDARVRALLDDPRLYPGERAALLRASSWETTDGVTAAEAVALAEAVAGGPPDRDAAAAAHNLLALCARLGAAEAAAAVVALLGPEPWAAWNATWGPARKHGGRPPETYLDALGAALAAAEPGVAADVGPAPAWAQADPEWQRELVRVKANPGLKLPWWRPWGGGLP